VIVRLTLGLDNEEKARFIVIGETIDVDHLMFTTNSIKIKRSAKALAHLIHRYTSDNFRDTFLNELNRLYDYEKHKDTVNYRALLEEGEKLLKEFEVQQKEEEEDE
jgi:phosphopentomutase